jgi:hypothetical protein
MWCSLIHNVQSGNSVSWGEELANIVTIDHEGQVNECSKVFMLGSRHYSSFAFYTLNPTLSVLS